MTSTLTWPGKRFPRKVLQPIGTTHLQPVSDRIRSCKTPTYPVVLSSEEAAIREVFEAMDLDDNKLISRSVKAVVCAPQRPHAELVVAFCTSQAIKSGLLLLLGRRCLSLMPGSKMQRNSTRVRVLVVFQTCLEPRSQQEGALQACFRRLDAEANGIISRSDIERQKMLWMVFEITAARG